MIDHYDFKTFIDQSIEFLIDFFKINYKLTYTDQDFKKKKPDNKKKKITQFNYDLFK